MRIPVYVIAFTLLVLLGLGAVPVHFDEAQYTTWLANPELSYQTKGPLVTFMQSLTHVEWLPQIVQVRVSAWMAWLVSGVLLVWLGALAGFDRDASRRLVILYALSPMLLALGSVQTTDIWLLASLLLALGAFASILHCRPNMHTELWWMLMGAALGIGALAKLSIALLPMALAPWVLLRKPQLLFSAGPYLGALLCALCMTPWILWNDANDYAHLAHELGHVDSDDDSVIYAIRWIPEMLLAVIPVVWVAVFGGISFRQESFLSDAQQTVREMLKWAAIAIITLFCIKGLFGKVLLNWTLPLVPFVLLALAAGLKWSPRTVLTAGVAQVAIYLMLLFPYGVGLSVEQDAFQKIRGWDGAVQRAADLAGPTDVLTSDHYGTLAWGLFFWPSELPGVDRYTSPVGQVIPEATRRKNQYDHWAVLDTPHPRIVHLGSPNPGLIRRCGTFNTLGAVPQVMPDGTIRSELLVSECLDFKPDPAWPEITAH